MVADTRLSRQPCAAECRGASAAGPADNECNYCPACQTGGRLLADRGLSRLLKKDWPRSLDEWDAHIKRLGS